MMHINSIEYTRGKAQYSFTCYHPWWSRDLIIYAEHEKTTESKICQSLINKTLLADAQWQKKYFATFFPHYPMVSAQRPYMAYKGLLLWI